MGPGSLRVWSTFLLKVKCPMISQEEYESTRLMMDFKVRDGFQDAPEDETLH